MAIAFLSLGAIAPAGACAYVWPGESAVLNPAKTDLTGPAKTILTKPTFLPANVAEAGFGKGVAEASRAAGVFQSAGVLPALGSVVAFGVGTVIGSEICGVLGIEGCWYFGSEAADPSKPSGVNWVYRTTPWTYTFEGVTLEGPAGDWVLSNSSTINSAPNGVSDNATEHCPATPMPGISQYLPTGKTTQCKSFPAEQRNVGVAVRYGMENRVLEYHSTDDPSISNYSYSAPGDWSSKLATQLKEAPEGSAAAHVGQKIASEIEGSGIGAPYGVVTVPNCSGEAWIGCEEVLEELDLVPERDELTWEDAHLDLDADAVVETSPAPGSKVTTGTKVTVTTNPDEAGMPLIVLQPEPGETYEDYAARLSPGLDPERITVSPEFTDPSTGPDGVIRTVPKSGTRINPDTEAQVDIHTNPPDAPPAAVAWSAPPISGLDLSPLSDVEIGCNDFPFGIFCWIGSGLTAWGPGGECPQLGVPFGSSVGLDSELAFDTCLFEPAMVVVRPVLILLSAFSLAFLFAAAAMGFGGSTGDD